MPRKLLFAAALLMLSHSLAADVTLDMSADRVFLSDGTVLKCTLICRGKESVVVLVDDQEKTLPASSVLRIERGKPAGKRKSFETGEVGGHEQIIGPVKKNVPPPPPSKPVAAKPARAGNKTGQGLRHLSADIIKAIEDLKKKFSVGNKQ